MKAVSRFEANLLRVLRGLLHQGPREQVQALLSKPMPRPKCLSRDAVELVQDALAKGCVQFLARRGWMRERFLREGKVVEGRLWDRTAPVELALTFSPGTLEFLLQLVSHKIGEVVPKVEALTVGDRFFLFLTFDVLKHLSPADEVRKHWIPLYQDGLCRMAFLEELAEGKQRFRIDWQTWTTGLGACILETLQGWLAERWIEVERKKERITAIARMRRIGAAQQRVFGEYLDALEQTERRDLARCFLDAAKRLLQDQPSSRKWTGNLDVGRERLADRQAIYREALAFLAQLERLHAWHQRALGVGYFDDGYHAGQLWKADWERHGGEQLFEQARAILREVEPI